MGTKELKAKFEDPLLQEHFVNIFPKDNVDNARFSINFFTAIGLGVLTDNLRDFLEDAPNILLQ